MKIYTKLFKTKSTNGAILLKGFFAVLCFILFFSSAKAQHCDGCSLNINGPTEVHVGDTTTYYVSDNNLHNRVAQWNYNSGGEINGGTIIDQGVDAYGNDYVTIYWSYFSYPNLTIDLNCDEDPYGDFYDEINITMLP